MSSESDEYRDVHLTDPKAMRALAHPVRMALFELLEVTGTLTATQASEALGESPANCAFHLRTLAKYGFVAEAGGGKGRERPWKRLNLHIHLSSNQKDPSATVTARTLQQVWLDRALERTRQVLSRFDELPEEWRDSEQANQSVVFLTPEETMRLGDEIHKLTRQYKDRQDDPAKRPPGALPVETLFFAYPLADLAEIAMETKPDA
jgi:predicted transcriptional regulator